MNLKNAHVKMRLNVKMRYTKDADISTSFYELRLIVHFKLRCANIRI